MTTFLPCIFRGTPENNFAEGRKVVNFVASQALQDHYLPGTPTARNVTTTPRDMSATDRDHVTSDRYLGPSAGPSLFSQQLFNIYLVYFVRCCQTPLRLKVEPHVPRCSCTR